MTFFFTFNVAGAPVSVDQKRHTEKCASWPEKQNRIHRPE
jgi:hypothetical protein